MNTQATLQHIQTQFPHTTLPFPPLSSLPPSFSHSHFNKLMKQIPKKKKKKKKHKQNKTKQKHKTPSSKRQNAASLSSLASASSTLHSMKTPPREKSVGVL
jgi:hypothetical protein